MRLIVFTLLSVLVAFVTVPSTRAADLVVEFVPDEESWLPEDLVTGKLVVTNSSNDTMEFELFGLSATVRSPGGKVCHLKEVEQGLRVRLPQVSLCPSGQVFRAVCFGKNNGKYVLSRTGNYEVVFKLLIRVNQQRQEVVARPKTLLVRGIGSPPENYYMVLRHNRDLFGAFDFGLARQTIDDLWKLEFGDYRPTIMAYMMYQGWHMSPRQLVFSKETMAGRHVGVNLEKVYQQIPFPEIRGNWIYERIGHMRKEMQAWDPKQGPYVFVDGDLLF